MVFSSHVFCFYFLPLALGVYFLVPRRLCNLELLVFSYVFYGWSNPAFSLIMILSTAIDYFAGLGMAARGPLDPGGPRSRAQKTWLVASICSNLGLLAFFKYHDFGIASWNDAVATLGLESLALDATLRVTLPLGISFYTFQSMSYSIDVYRGRTPAMRNVIDFATFVAMFPQLVAGPILRFSEVADQLRGRRETLDKAVRGLAFFALGMGKKILLANPCGKLADTAFDAGSLTVLDAWLGAAAYAFQIYFDFSGYSDMAIGLGLFFGFTFPKNFDSPYRSQSITEFWRRWHLSLSRWLRDYLYLPLGGNRHGPARTYRNLLLVMLLGGLWHGAAWNFVAWGAFHGVLLAAERAWGRDRAWGFLPAPLRVAWTFVLVLVSWVFFRADSLADAAGYLAAMAGLAEPAPTAALVAALLHAPYYLATFALAAVATWTAPQTWDFTRRLDAGRLAYCFAVLALALTAMETQGYNPFIYFIF